MSKDPVDGTTEAVEKEKHPFELIVGAETGEILNGDIPVRWCVTPELVNELEKHEVEDAHVLLVTATEKGTEMDRKLVPITELMTYVRFTRAGTMKIYGFIMSGRAGRKKLYQTYRQKSGGEYATGVICDYTEKPYDDIKYEYTRTQVDVMIPAGVFGKEPGPWMKWFVNMWHTSSGRVVDECHYRRRLILAFTLKWIPVVIWTTGMIVARLGFVLGMAGTGYYKNMKWARVFRPYEYNNLKYHVIDDVPDENSFILSRTHERKSSGRKYEIPMLITLPIFPAVLAVQALIIGFALAGSSQTLSFLTLMGTVSAVLFTVTAVYDLGYWIFHTLSNMESLVKIGTALDSVFETIVLGISAVMKLKYVIWFGYAIGGALLIFTATIWLAIAIYGFPVIIVMFLAWKFSDAWLEHFENMYTVSPENNDYTEIRELLCPKDELNLQADIDFIPSKQRTVRLWYLEMKHKICKPMQQ